PLQHLAAGSQPRLQSAPSEARCSGRRQSESRCPPGRRVIIDPEGDCAREGLVRTLFRRKKRPLLHALRVGQDGDHLRLEVVPDAAIAPSALWSRSATTGAWTQHTSLHRTGRRYAGVLDLADIAHGDQALTATARSRHGLFLEVTRTIAAS